MVISQKLFISSIVFFLLLLCTASCNTTEPPPDKTVLTLTLEDVSCTEAWVTLTTNNLQLPAILNLLKDNTITKTINLQTADTLLYIDSLLPNTSYQYQVTSIQSATGGPVSSNELSVTTLDTTSHNFTWQTFEFGQHSSSTLYDVAIIDENNIWAVGEIYMLDTLGNPDHTTYNAVHWDGQKWELKRITVNFRGGLITPPLEGVFAFSCTDIWFVGSLPIRGDGANWTIYDLRTTIDPSLTLSKAWGRSSNDMYFVGRNGNIAHWNGVKWTKIESGISLDIHDIWGSNEMKSNDYEIIAIASNIFTNDGKEVIRISNGSVQKLSTNGLSAYFEGIWFKSGRRYYVVGGGIHTKQNINFEKNWYRYPAGVINYHYSTSVRGNDLNDIFIAGSAGEILHYNGYGWKNYLEEITLTNGGLLEIKINKNQAATVGYNGSKAIIFLGKRN